MAAESFGCHVFSVEERTPDRLRRKREYRQADQRHHDQTRLDRGIDRAFGLCATDQFDQRQGELGGDLADEAFLRRIPYKIQINDPSEADFRELFRREAEHVGMSYDERVIDVLVQKHYRDAARPLRCCHARDLLRQIKHYCEFKGLPVEMTTERFDLAVRNYFAAVG